VAEDLRTEELDKLVLVWLLVPRKSPGLTTLARMLAPFVRRTGASAESVARQSLARLKAGGDIEADTTWMLSPAGRDKALRTLGISALPKRVSWSWISKLLLARATGTEPKPSVMRSLGTADGLAAAVLQRARGLPTNTPLSPKQVAQALAWRELGVESTAPITRNAILAHIARKASPSAPARKLPKAPFSAAIQALAWATLGDSPKDASIQTTLIQRWMAGPKATEPVERRPPINDAVHHIDAPLSADASVQDTIVDAPSALRVFADRAVAAARTSKTGRWGEQKVFISHVWDQYCRDDAQPAIELDTFKKWLVRANQAGFLSLSRADLIDAMDANDVRRSEISSLGATFHFIKS
jgi:hypothetical protein